MKVLCALLALSMVAAARPGSISGRVTALDGTPLKGAHVSVSGSNQTATTSDDGTFTITSLPPSHYDVTAELAGYDEARRRFVVESGKITKVELKLSKRAP